MLPQIKKYWHIFWHLRSLSLMTLTEYRASFLFWSVVSIMWTGFNFFFYDILAGVAGNIGGWNRHEILLLISVFVILDSLTWSFFYPNMRAYTMAIFSGDFNTWLLKPADAQFMAMTSTNSLTNIFRFIIGVVMVGVSLQALQLQPSLGQIILFIVALICSCLFIYFSWFTLSTLAFWVEKLDNVNEFIPAFRTLWQMPRSIYTGITSFVFTILLPFGLVTSLPTEVLMGKAPYGWLAYFVLATVVVIFFSRWFFFFSARKFSGSAQ